MAVTKSETVNPSGKDATGAIYAELVREAAGGDREAMERLLMRAQETAYRFSLLVCGHPQDAEDVMQDALLKTYRYVSRIKEPEAFRTWLYRTVKNACLMSRRTSAHQPARTLSLDDEGAAEVASSAPNPEQQTAAASERRRFQEAFKSLPRPFRLVAFLRDVEGLSTREVADVVGISEDNVKQRLHRARTLLRKALA